MSAFVAALWAFTLLGVELLCGVLTTAARGDDSLDVVSLAACAVLATSVLVFAVLRVHAQEGSIRQAIGLAPIAPHHVILCAVAGAGLSPVLDALRHRIVARFPYSDADLALVDKLVAGAPPAVLIVAMLVIIPISEEIFFRGLLYGGVRASSGAREAIVVTAVLYAIVGQDFREVPVHLLLGLALGLLRAQSGSLIGPVVAALAYNAFDAVALVRGDDPTAVPFSVKWAGIGAVATIFGLAAMRFGRASKA
jgi:membrane protease YdiL (CAAX protease family)